MDSLNLKGPYKFIGEPSIFDALDEGVNGVYLWCVKTDDDLFRVYYVGEAIDIKKRMRVHLGNQRSGKYTGHNIGKLKENIRILMHRAKEGMIPRFSHIDSESYNKEIAENLYLFYSQLPTAATHHDSKWLRCRYETGLVTHIENQGQNIVSVGSTWNWKGDPDTVNIDTGSSNIEYLSGQEMIV